MILGIDTSNYKTSVAIVSEDGRVIADCRKLLTVKRGERGLRQSEAFFQHVNRLPDLLDEAMSKARDFCKQTRGSLEFSKVVVSTRPRSCEGSYMPCFLAGLSFAKAFASGSGAEVLELSHQDGHLGAVQLSLMLDAGMNVNEIARAVRDSRDSGDYSFAAFHFSGGTTEALICKAPMDDEEPSYKVEICGGTKDISYGQLLDRIGVARGLDFPCGEEIDEIACNFNVEDGFKNSLPKIKVTDGFINLSGLETYCQRQVDKPFDLLCYETLQRVCESIIDMIYFINKNEGIKTFYFAGGVSASRFMRNFITKSLDEVGKMKNLDIEVKFAEPRYSADNAVGLAMIGGILWQ